VQIPDFWLPRCGAGVADSWCGSGGGDWSYRRMEEFVEGLAMGPRWE